MILSTLWITTYYYYVRFFTEARIAIFFISHFWLLIPIMYSSLYLIYPTVIQRMHCFFKASHSLMFFPSIILTSSHKGNWLPFSFYICSAIPDFSILLCTTDFRCSTNLTFNGQHVSPLYTLPQQHGMEYIRFLVMFTRKRFSRRVGPLLNIVLISYGLNIFWIFSAWPLT